MSGVQRHQLVGIEATTIIGRPLSDENGCAPSNGSPEIRSINSPPKRSNIKSRAPSWRKRRLGVSQQFPSRGPDWISSVSSDQFPQAATRPRNREEVELAAAARTRDICFFRSRAHKPSSRTLSGARSRVAWKARNALSAKSDWMVFSAPVVAGLFGFGLEMRTCEPARSHSVCSMISRQISSAQGAIGAVKRPIHSSG